MHLRVNVASINCRQFFINYFMILALQSVLPFLGIIPRFVGKKGFTWEYLWEKRVHVGLSVGRTVCNQVWGKFYKNVEFIGDFEMIDFTNLAI